jgi:hypothetical protein
MPCCGSGSFIASWTSHPECLIAELGSSGLILRALLDLTYFWRRRVDAFEVLGLDQARRLTDIGIAEERIRLKPNPSPVSFTPGIAPLPLPDELRERSGVILYSGNWGVAHDENTFIEAYSEYLLQSKRGLQFWLNATGAKADHVERELRSRGILIYRTRLVPLDDLPRLLLSADVHLVTLRDPFVGYVLPSKIHACIESGKRILFVGSTSSDVHLLASRTLPPDRYCQVNMGDVPGLLNALRAMERAVASERVSAVVRLDHAPVLTRPGPRRSLQPAVRSHKPGADVDSPIKSCRGCGARSNERREPGPARRLCRP